MAGRAGRPCGEFGLRRRRLAKPRHGFRDGHAHDGASTLCSRRGCRRSRRLGSSRCDTGHSHAHHGPLQRGKSDGFRQGNPQGWGPQKRFLPAGTRAWFRPFAEVRPRSGRIRSGRPAGPYNLWSHGAQGHTDHGPFRHAVAPRLGQGPQRMPTFSAKSSRFRVSMATLRACEAAVARHSFRIIRRPLKVKLLASKLSTFPSIQSVWATVAGRFLPISPKDGDNLAIRFT